MWSWSHLLGWWFLHQAGLIKQRTGCQFVKIPFLLFVTRWFMFLDVLNICNKQAWQRCDIFWVEKRTKVHVLSQYKLCFYKHLLNVTWIITLKNSISDYILKISGTFKECRILVTEFNKIYVQIFQWFSISKSSWIRWRSRKTRQILKESNSFVKVLSFAYSQGVSMAYNMNKMRIVLLFLQFVEYHLRAQIEEWFDEESWWYFL